jgi:hypothetical protein
MPFSGFSISFLDSYLISRMTPQESVASNAFMICPLNFSALDLFAFELNVNCTVGAAKKQKGK